MLAGNITGADICWVKLPLTFLEIKAVITEPSLGCLTRRYSRLVLCQEMYLDVTPANTVTWKLRDCGLLQLELSNSGESRNSPGSMLCRKDWLLRTLHFPVRRRARLSVLLRPATA